MPLDRSDFLFRFLYKEFEQLRIHVLGNLRDNGQRHDRGGLHWWRVCKRDIFLRYRCRMCLDVFDRELHRVGYLDPTLFLVLQQSPFRFAKYGEASFGVVKHVPGLATACLDRLHVILDADNGICEAVGFFLIQLCRATATEHGRDQAADILDDFHGARFVEHQQSGLNPAQQRRHAIKPQRRRSRGDTLSNCFFDASKINDALAHYRRGYLAKCVVIFL